MKLKLDRVISLVTLGSSLIAVALVLKKPAPVAQPQSPAAIVTNAQSFDQKIEALEQPSMQPPQQSGVNYQPIQSPDPSVPLPATPPTTEVRINSAEIDAALAQAVGATAGTSLSPDSNLGSGAPAIKDQQVSFEGDLVHGQFLTEIAGKDVWVTVSGHLTSKDGYASFEPTEFKVGDLSVPVSLVNPALQKKLAEQRDRLKLPDYVGDVKVQNGELVMQKK